ncbi:hypothetical protein D3C75_1320960 [compost metagenome]
MKPFNHARYLHLADRVDIRKLLAADKYMNLRHPLREQKVRIVEGRGTAAENRNSFPAQDIAVYRLGGMGI